MKYILFIILLFVANTVTYAKWDYYNDSNSIVKGGASSIVVDYNNTVWVKTGDGIVAIDGDKWTLYDSTDSDYIKYSTDLTIDNYGNLWFVSNGRVVKYEDGNFIKIDSLYGAKLIEFDSNNNYWVASSLSIFKHEGDKFIEKYRGIRDELEFTKLIINGKDNIYFSRFFYSDLCQLKADSTVICFNSQNSGVPNNYSFYSSAMDSNGNLWLGDNWNIIKFDGSNWTVLDTLKSNDNHIGRFYRAIGVDKNNTLWTFSNYSFTFNSYLFRIDKNIECYVLDKDHLGDEIFNQVANLAIDFNGNVWIASTMGLFKFTPELTNIDNYNSNKANVDITYKENYIGITSQESLKIIEIFDLMGGNVIANSDIDAHEYTLDTSELAKGLYILRVNNKSYKFMKW